MDCRQVRRALSALLDGDLSANDAAEVRGHLAHCSHCRRVYNAYQQDMRALGQFLRTAPWLPVADRVHERVEKQRLGRGFWGTLIAGGNQLATGAAVVAVVALVVASGLALRGMANNGLGTTGPRSGGIGTEVATPARPTITANAEQAVTEQAVMDALEQAGLAFPIDQTVELDGQTLHFQRLAVDRGVTYLEYERDVHSGIEDSNELDILLIGKQDDYFSRSGASQAPATGPTADPPPSQNWLQFPGLDDLATDSVTIRVQPRDGESTEIRIPVDLAPLRALPAPEPFDVSATANGITLGQFVLERGAVVSTVTWQATVVEPGAVVPINVEAMKGQWKSLAAEVITPSGTQAIHVLGLSGGSTSDGGKRVHETATQLFELPETGMLRISVERLSLHGIAGSDTRLAQGPWTVAIPLGDPAATPTPEAVETPQPTTLPTVEPTATPDPQPTRRLPSDLYFIGADETGYMALWVQPADGSAPRKLVGVEQRDVSDFTLIPGTNRIAYQVVTMHDDSPEAQAARLISIDGADYGVADVGLATMPEGELVAEYVSSPNGSQVAYVPLNGRAVWVSQASGEGLTKAYEVTIPESEGVMDVEWSPDGSKLLFWQSRIADKSWPIVVSADGTVLWEATTVAIDAAWSPDGTELVYSSYDGIHRVDLATGGATDITPQRLRESPEPRLFFHLAWLDDGRIAFTHHEDTRVHSPADLWLMQSDGRDAWRARVDFGAVTDMAWTRTEDGYGFVATWSNSPAAGPSGRAGLTFFPTYKAEPRDLVPDIPNRIHDLTWDTR